MISVKDTEDNDQLGKRLRLSREPIEFGDEDLEGTTKPHDDSLIVTSKIGAFVVKRVLIDKGSRAEVMCPDQLKPKDLSKYDTPLVGFMEKW